MIASAPMGDRDDYNLRTYREPNLQTIAEIRSAARDWRAVVELANDARANLDDKIIKAFKAGHSYAQLREATGLGTGTLQTILSKVGLAADPNQKSRKR